MTQEHCSELTLQDPRIDQDLIDSIDNAYFNDDHSFDITKYNLEVT